MVFTPLPDMPLVRPGSRLSRLILDGLNRAGVTLQDGDILVVAQKIVSKAEGRMVRLSDVTPSPRAVELSRVVEKDARFIELVLSESRAVLRCRPGTIIVEHRQGFVCANAGIDHSNVHSGDPNEEWFLLLPEDSDRSAAQIQKELQEAAGVEHLGVLINDSHGRAWRLGTTGAAIGIAGMPGLVDLRGETDLFGYKLRVTQVAAADELAAGASLLMGQAAEARPVVHVRGFPYPLRAGSLQELLRPEEMDLFR